MQNGCMEHEENIYRACRKRAAEYNENLKSMDRTAELLGVSTSTLSNYELGLSKSIPVDMVVMMADLYHAPEIKNLYCKNECPIGRNLPMATAMDSLQGITIKILNSLDDDSVKNMKKRLLDISMDGKIDDSEKPDFDLIVQRLDALASVISELRMLAEKSAKGR